MFIKKFLFFVLLIFIALSTTVSAKEINLKVNSVGLGTSQSTVLRKLGTPLQSKKGEFSECGGGFYKTLSYSGLIIELLSDDKGDNYSVVSMVVTSSKWSVASEINIGADTKKVKKRFGEPLGSVDITI